MNTAERRELRTRQRAYTERMSPLAGFNRECNCVDCSLSLSDNELCTSMTLIVWPRKSRFGRSKGDLLNDKFSHLANDL